MKSARLSILKIGLVIGLIDGIAAVLNAYLGSGVLPENVFRFIASGVFGMEAFTGGGAMMAWGVIFHFAIALLWTAAFVFIAFNVRYVLQHPLKSGMLFGFLVWLLMHVVVLPLSKTPGLKSAPLETLIMIAIHVFVIGIPMSYMVQRDLRLTNQKRKYEERSTKYE